VQLHKHATQQDYATQSEAEPETPNPHTGRETGLNNLSRGLSEPAHRSPAGGTRRDVRARPTQGRVAPAKGNAKLPALSLNIYIPALLHILGARLALQLWNSSLTCLVGVVCRTCNAMHCNGCSPCPRCRACLLGYPTPHHKSIKMTKKMAFSLFLQPSMLLLSRPHTRIFPATGGAKWGGSATLSRTLLQQPAHFQTPAGPCLCTQKFAKRRCTIQQCHWVRQRARGRDQAGSLPALAALLHLTCQLISSYLQQVGQAQHKGAVEAAASTGWLRHTPCICLRKRWASRVSFMLGD
jgi:hypothetical protein